MKHHAVPPLSKPFTVSREIWRCVQPANGPGMAGGIKQVRGAERSSGESGRQSGRPSSRPSAG